MVPITTFETNGGKVMNFDHNGTVDIYYLIFEVSLELTADEGTVAVNAAGGNEVLQILINKVSDISVRYDTCLTGEVKADINNIQKPENEYEPETVEIEGYIYVVEFDTTSSGTAQIYNAKVLRDGVEEVIEVKVATEGENIGNAAEYLIDGTDGSKTINQWFSYFTSTDGRLVLWDRVDENEVK